MDNCKNLAITAQKARILALDAVKTASSGHLGGSVSIIDTLVTLYFDIMKIDPQDSKNPDRARFILSKGHCSPACHSVLALPGSFPAADLP